MLSEIVRDDHRAYVYPRRVKCLDMPTNLVWLDEWNSTFGDDLYISPHLLGLGITARQNGAADARRFPIDDIDSLRDSLAKRWQLNLQSHYHEWYRAEYMDIAERSALSTWKFMKKTAEVKEAIDMAEKISGWNVEVVKQAAEGRWQEIISQVTGISEDCLDGREQPCPKCGGTDRFNAFKDFDETGGMICRQCSGGCGDGLASIQWLTGCTFPEALANVAKWLNIDPVRRNDASYDRKSKSYKWKDGVDRNAERSDHHKAVNFLSSAFLNYASSSEGQEDFEKTNDWHLKGYDHPTDLKTFLDTDYSIDYLIENCIAQKSPCIIAGASKSMKTTISLHAALAIASGKPFLGKFATQQRPVLFASSESGLAVIKRNLLGMARMMDINLRDLMIDGIMSFQSWVPRLSDIELMKYFEGILEWEMQSQDGVLVLDPLYQSLDGQTAANLSLNGEQIQMLTKMCLQMGVTPIVDDHVKRASENAQRYQPITLEDITGAGKAEFFRQWMLLGRRSRFDDFDPDSRTRNHDLWLTVGGSAGHSGTYGLDISETISDGALTIDYAIELRKASEIREERKEKTVEKRDKTFIDFASKAIRWIKSQPNEPITVNDVKNKMRCNADKANQLIVHLVDEAIIRKMDDTVKRGRNPRCEAWIMIGELPLE
jgi:AAA domain/Zinc-binding domain of primase-helicase